MRELPIFNNPPKGDPCNNCGMCCVMEACAISVAVFGDERTPCAALESVGDKFLCGLIRNPQKYVVDLPEFGKEYFANTVAEMLGVGKGCCAEV